MTTNRFFLHCRKVSALHYQHECLGDDYDRDLSAERMIFFALSKLQPDWYFDDRGSSDLPALMRKVQETLDTEETQEVFSLQR